MMQTFHERMRGPFRGMLHWSDLDALWVKVRANPEGWHISQSGTDPMTEPVSVAVLETFIQEMDALLRREHECAYCGIVFVDDAEQPGFIKIHDPNNVGSMCGSGGAPILPRWVLSRMVPERIDEVIPLTASRQRWWQKLFG